MSAPLFVDVDGPNAVRPDLPFVERDAVLVVLRHWSEDLYLGLRWRTVAWETLITGGVEEGQTAETAALAEIAQETGYLSARLERFLSPVEARFYHGPKAQNRHARFTAMAFSLANGRRAPVADDEAALHEPAWLGVEEMGTFGLPPAQRYAWDEYLRS